MQLSTAFVHVCIVTLRAAWRPAQSHHEDGCAHKVRASLLRVSSHDVTQCVQRGALDQSGLLRSGVVDA